MSCPSSTHEGAASLIGRLGRVEGGAAGSLDSLPAMLEGIEFLAQGTIYPDA